MTRANYFCVPGPSRYRSSTPSSLLSNILSYGERRDRVLRDLRGISRCRWGRFGDRRIPPHPIVELRELACRRVFRLHRLGSHPPCYGVRLAARLDLHGLRAPPVSNRFRLVADLGRFRSGQVRSGQVRILS